MDRRTAVLEPTEAGTALRFLRNDAVARMPGSQIAAGRSRRDFDADPKEADWLTTARRPVLGSVMETSYRIVPRRRSYRVEGVAPNGTPRLLGTWPTEEAAVSHLKSLREVAERIERRRSPGAQDWRGQGAHWSTGRS
jgi:hypothetical protein